MAEKGAARRVGGGFDGSAFRNVLGIFPTGVCVLTARTPDGEDLGFTISSFNSLSINPPLVLFSISREAHSLPKWAQCDEFVINVLSSGQSELSDKFAKALSDKWRGVDFARGVSGAPVLTNTAATLQCRQHALHDGGDHLLFLARVLQFELDPASAPLVFCMGKYHLLGT